MKKKKIVIGNTYYPQKQKIIVSDNVVSGNRWEVWREEDSYYFEFDTGELGENFRRIKITELDFQNIKEGTINKKDLIKKYKL